MQRVKQEYLDSLSEDHLSKKLNLGEGIILEINTNDSNRHQWVSVAAYFKAEARGFGQGKELEDWLTAEIEYKEFQIQLFLLRSQEDGGMLISNLQDLADSVCVENPKQISSEVDLIREIQKVTEHRSCFRISYQEKCEDSESECPWREECQKLLAVWYR